MLTGMKRMWCGNCGCDEFKLFTPNDKDGYTDIAVECQKCKDVSHIRPVPAQITIEWGENSNGRIVT
jgi:hypothetical protein